MRNNVLTGSLQLIRLPKIIRILPYRTISMENGQNGVARSKTFCGADRVKNQPDSVWTEFTTLAKEHNAVNVGQGFPDTLPPKVLVDALKSALSNDNFAMHQYTRGFGHPRLTDILAKLYSRLFNTTINSMKEVTITVGGYNALFCAFFAFLNPGDEAVIIEPYFDCYSAQIEMTGAKPVFVPLRLVEENVDNGSLSTSDFALDMNELEMSFTPKTKLIVLNNPNNPLGKVFTRDELNNIAKLAKKYNLIVISDEVYEWIVYPGIEMIRFASLPDMWERTLTIGSAGKAFSATGWKTGWAIGPDGLMKHLRALHQNCTYSCPTVLQEAVAIAFEKEFDLLFTAQSYFKQMSNDLLRKRDRMNDFLSSVGMRPILPEGGYFMLADFSKIGAPYDNLAYGSDSKDYKVARWMVKEKKLSCIPLSAFYCSDHRFMGENMIRFCFCKSDSTLEAAEKIIKSWQSSSN